MSTAVINSVYLPIIIALSTACVAGAERRAKRGEIIRERDWAHFIDGVEGNFMLITERVELAFIDSVWGKKHHSTVKPVSLRVSVTRKLSYNFHHSVKMETKQPCLSKFTVCRRQAAPPFCSRRTCECTGKPAVVRRHVHAFWQATFLTFARIWRQTISGGNWKTT